MCRLVLLIFMAVFSSPLQAVLCPDDDRYPARGHHTNAKLTIFGNSQIIGGPSNGLLPFERSTPSSLPANSCGSGIQCQILGCVIADTGSPNFTVTGGEDYDIDEDGAAVTFGAGGDHPGYLFGEIELEAGTAHFLPPVGENEYEIEELNIDGDSILKLSPGTYWVEELEINSNAKLIVDGVGTVILYIKSAWDTASNTEINYDSQDNFDPEQLRIIVNSSVMIGSNSKVAANIYSKLDSTLNGNAEVYGRVLAKNVNMFSNAKICRYVDCTASPPATLGFDITTDADGLTCHPHDITIQATNSGVPDPTYGGTIVLSTSSGSGEWSKITGSGNLNTVPADDDGTASYTFHGDDNGLVKLGLFHKIADSVIADVLDGITTVASPVITMRPYGLKVVGGIPNQVANTPFAIQLTAVGKDEVSSGCSVIEQYTGSKVLRFWFDYTLPAGFPANKSVEVKGSVIGKSESLATPFNVTFTAGVSDGASVTVRYPDAGKIELRLKDDTGLGAPPADPGNELRGGGGILFNPYQLAIKSIVKTGASTANHGTEGSGLKFIRAANPTPTGIPALSDVDRFDVTVDALIDCSGPVSQVNPCPDTSSQVIADSFQNDLTFSAALVFPDPGITPPPEVGTVKLAAQPSLVHTMTGYGSELVGQFTYAEVGTINLSVKSDDYIQVGNNIPLSSAVKVGRFYPAYIGYSNFATLASCNDQYTYMDNQDLAVSYRLTAYNQSGGVTTNYDNDRLGYRTAGATLDSPEFVYGLYNSSLIPLTSRLLYKSEVKIWKNGVYELSVPAGSIADPNDSRLIGVVKRTNGPDGPYLDSDNSKLSLSLKVKGEDDEKLQDTSAVTPAICAPALHPALDYCLLGSIQDLLYGRLNAGSRFGSELSELRVPLKVEYYNGSEFEINLRDDCTSLNYPAAINPVSQHSFQHGAANTPAQNPPIPVRAASSNLSMINKQAVQGELNLLYSPPEDTGAFHYFIDLNHVTDSLCWLRYDWNGDGAITNLCGQGNTTYCAAANRADDCTRGTVSFGLYRGNDRVIYRREVSY